MAERNTPPYEIEGRSAAGAAFAQVREMATAMVAEGRSEEAFDFLLSALEAVLRKSRELEMLIARLRRAGRSSERVDPKQLALLFEELIEQLGTDSQAPEAEARADAELEREIRSAEAARGERGEPGRGPSRSWRTQEVKRDVHKLEVPAEERRCGRCGKEKQKIGEDISRTLEYVPGHFVEHEYHREKWACGTCKWGVSTAPAQDKLIERSAADASVLAHVVVSKHVDHTPLHRLHRIYQRSGATIPVSTLSDWTGEVAERITPLVERIAARILHEAYVVRTDATGLRVLDPSSPEHIHPSSVKTTSDLIDVAD